MRRAALIATVFLLGCGGSSGGQSDGPTVYCVPGQMIECYRLGCVDKGVQVCKGDGSGYGACICEEAAQDGGADAAADAPAVQVDAAPDASPDSAPDGPPAQDASQHDAAVQTDVGPQRDAPSANHDTGTSLVQCGSSSCDLAAGEECCITGTTLECVAADTCAGYGTLACDGPEDCFEADQPVCCARMTTAGGGAACDTAAGCTGSGAYRLCRVDPDCGGGQKCCGSLAYGAVTFQYCLPDADCNASVAAPGVPCGTGVTCYAPDACCQSFSGGSCTVPASCTQGVALLCDGPEDCQQDGGTAQLCCLNVNTGGGGSVCVTTCTQTGLFFGVLCHSNADCTSPATCRTVSVTGYTFRRCQ